jgi:hypothetical protein
MNDCRRCKQEPGTIRLEYDKYTHRGVSRYVTAPIGMRCADKEALAVLSRRNSPKIVTAHRV